MSNDDFGDGGGDWGDPVAPPPSDDNIDMNYGQPLGQSQPQPPPGELQKTKPKLENDDIVKLAISFFLPGVGHLMLGQTVKGIVIFLLFVFTCGFGGLINIAILLDTYLCLMTQKYRQLGDWEFFPDTNKHF